VAVCQLVRRPLLFSRQPPYRVRREVALSAPLKIAKAPPKSMPLVGLRGNLTTARSHPASKRGRFRDPVRNATCLPASFSFARSCLPSHFVEADHGNPKAGIRFSQTLVQGPVFPVHQLRINLTIAIYERISTWHKIEDKPDSISK
jgi:hypothetical protein